MITIIVLLILAGVTISMVLGDDGIIAQAQSAKKAQEKANEKEAIEVAKGEAAIAQYGKQTPMSATDLNTALGKPEGTITTNTSVARVVDGVPIPIGFAYVEGTKKETGLIIVDGEDNEFVWVPVDNPIYDATTNPTGMFTKTVEGNTTTYTGKLYDWENWSGTGSPSLMNSNFVEPSSAGLDTTKVGNMIEEYNKMAKSVETYGGFYVGRYETSWTGSKVASVPNVSPMHDENWYTFYLRQRELYENSSSVVSGMIYGSQWDAIMDWMRQVPNPDSTKEDKLYITNSTKMGNYATRVDCPECNGESGYNWSCEICWGDGYTAESLPIKTGSNSAYCVKNIFDLAGNYFEWTQESGDSSSRVCRGGYYDDRGLPASLRYYDYPTLACVSYSSRLQLYIK